MSSELEGKIALVTGASRGIGAGIATALAQAGADVAVDFISREAEARNLRGKAATESREGVWSACSLLPL